MVQLIRVRGPVMYRWVGTLPLSCPRQRRAKAYYTFFYILKKLNYT